MPDADRVATLFRQALELDAPERPGFLESACGSPELRAEVESLLRAHEVADGFLEHLDAQRGAALLEGTLEAESAGRRVGPYRLIRELGRGGMGVVYLAERAEGGFEQRVAIKLVKRGMDTDAILDRFLRERQILASLEHPNVARLLEGGVTEDGQPYFAMEYVDGAPLTDDCDARRLGIEERLALFEQACRAVQYAHSKLVVHRDLKPSNILVTPQGHLKLLDFGVAKLLAEGGEAAATALTRAGLRVLTPDYAAPEQVRGEPVTTATDVYALGVVLYELLTGRRPYSGESAEALARAVCETEPEPPSVAVARRPRSPAEGGSPESTPERVALARHITSERLARRLKGDLDTIALKALAKEPARRYASAEAMAEDIRRHLAGHPVQARRDTVGYRSAKFVRRHAVGVSAVVLVIVALATGLTVALSQRGVARREAAKAAEVRAFLVKIFEVSDPGQARGEKVTARELLDRGAERVQSDLKGQPEVQGEILDLIGQLFYKLGIYERAVGQYEQALTVRRRLYGPDHPEVAKSLSGESMALVDMGEYDRARSVLEDALRIQRQRLGGEHADLAQTLDWLGLVHAEKGNYEEAERLQREALAIYRRALGPDDVRVADLLSNLGLTLRWKGDLIAAEPIHREALEMHLRLRGSEHPRTAWAYEHLGVGLDIRGDYAAAEPLLREGLAILKRTLGEEHPDTALATNNLAKVLLAQGDSAAAEPLFRWCLALNTRLHGPESRFVATNLTNVAETLTTQGKYAEAIRTHEQALALRRKLLGSGHPEVAMSLHYLARSRLLAGRLDQAEPLQAEALQLGRAAWHENHPFLARMLAGLGELHLALGRPSLAEAPLRESFKIREKTLVEKSWELAEVKSLLGDCLVRLGRYEEAEPLLRTGYAVLVSKRGEADRMTRRARAALTQLESARGDEG